MARVRIWTVESDYDAESLKSLVNSLAANLQFNDLSVQTVGSKGFLMSNKNGKGIFEWQTSKSSSGLPEAG